jgi:hypothetical protein
MVKVRRVLFRDWVKEADGTNPSRWVQNSGTWTVQSNTIQFNSLVGTGVAVAPAEQTVLCATVAQDGEMYYDITMNPVDYDTGDFEPVMAFVMFASASSGAYLGNSYVLAIESDTVYLYRSDANVLTLLDSQAATFSKNVPHDFVVHYTPSTGDWTVDLDDVLVLEATDDTYTTGDYLGLRAEYVQGRFSLIRARCPDMETVSRITVSSGMTKSVGEAHVYYGQEGDSATSFVVGDGIEIVFEGVSSETVDFWGKVERLIDCLEDTDEIVAYDWRVELLKAEAFQSTTTDKVSELITNMIGDKCRILTTGGVKETTDTADTRNISGERLLAGFKRLALEVGYFITYDGEKELIISDTFTASGLTLTEDDIIKAERVNDLVGEVNTVRTYHAGGVTTGGGSGAAYEAYGRSENIMVDSQCPNATQAAARATTITDRYSGDKPTYDIWSTVDTLNPGDTGTISLDWFDVDAQTFLVLEKFYDIPDGCGTRYRINITGTVKERHLLSGKDSIARHGEDSTLGLGLGI